MSGTKSCVCIASFSASALTFASLSSFASSFACLIASLVGGKSPTRGIATEAVMSRKVECVSSKSSDRALLVPDSIGVGTRPAKSGPNYQQFEAAGGQKWAKFHFHLASRYLCSQDFCLNSELEIKKLLLQDTLRLMTASVALPLQRLDQ